MIDRPADLLRLAVDGARAEEVAARLATAIRLVGTRRAANLEDGLGLRPGELRAWCRTERDAWLRRAADLAAPGEPPGTQVKVLLALAARTGAARRRARLVGAWPNDEAVQALCIAESCGTLPASRQLYKVLQARDAVRCDASAEPAAYGSGLTPSEASAA